MRLVRGVGAAVVSSLVLSACFTPDPNASGWNRHRGDAVITDGVVHGERWELVAFVDQDGRRCIDVRVAKGGPGSCYKGSLTEAVSVSRGDVQTRDQSTMSFVSGSAARGVTRMTIEFADGSVSDVPIVGQAAGFDVNFFALPLEPESCPSVLTAEQAGGRGQVKKTLIPPPDLHRPTPARNC